MTFRLLTRLFALFGMTLTCVACYGVEYQEYDPSFAASGRVVDEEGNPIQGIRVKLGHETYTDAMGGFYAFGRSQHLEFEDVDGAENGGDFESRTITLEKMGSMEDVGDVTLTQK